MAWLTFVGGHWTLVIAAVLAVVACGALAFFLKNWKFAVAAIAIAIVGFTLQGAVTDGIKLQMQKDAKAYSRMLEDHLNAVEDANRKNAEQAQHDAETIANLQKQIDEDTPKNDNSCGDAGFARRMRNFR